MNKSLIVIYTAIGLDAAGIGLVFPILPRLLEEVTGSPEAGPLIGLLTALYALAQFAFSPVLGALSDRLGRRPVLLISLAGAAVNYLIMAVTPSIWGLLLGRLAAGMTGANMSVASAYITDISSREDRARRFGLVNAVFGAGLIIGPVLGGMLGDRWTRLPMIAAAVLNAADLAFALFLLPETRARTPGRIDPATLNPLRASRRFLARRELLPLILVFLILSATGEAYGTCWAMWGYDAFHWDGAGVGLSLGAFGVCQTLVQAFLPGPATRLLGERGAVLGGIACASVALVVLALADRGWIVFAAMPVFALGGIGTPALQALASRRVDPADQGGFQGVLASAIGLAAVIGPLLFSTLYVLVRAERPGAIWLSVVALYAVAVPLIVAATRRPDRARTG